MYCGYDVHSHNLEVLLMIIEIKDLPKGQIIKQIKVDVIFDESGAVTSSEEIVDVSLIPKTVESNINTVDDLNDQEFNKTTVKKELEETMSHFDVRPELDIPSEMLDNKF